MSEGLNLVMLMGNLGADPELTQTSGGPLLKMRLATTYVYLDKEKQKQEKTEWHTVKTWGKRAEGLARILSKGDRLCVKGRIETSSYEKDGEKRYRTEIIASDVYLAGGRGSRADSHGSSSSHAPGNGAMRRAPEAAVSLSELPF